MAVYTMQLAGNRTSPASREACRRAAVKPRPTVMSPEHPARQKARSPGCRGTTPALLGAEGFVEGLEEFGAAPRAAGADCVIADQKL